MKALAIGDWTQSPTPLTSMEVMLRWGRAEISNPLTTCLVSLGTPMSHLISINSGVVKVLWITLLSLGNSKGFKNSVPGNEDKGQIHLCVFLIIPQVDKKSTLNSLEGLLLKLKPQYFGHLIQRTDSLAKTLMLGKLEGGRRGDNRGWDSWMASPTQWTWVWASSGRWWSTRKPGVLQSVGLQRVRYDWETEQQQVEMWMHVVVALKG